MSDFENVTIGVTGATGQLGRRVVTQLLNKGVRPESVIAIVRDQAKASEIAALGVTVRVADYQDADQYQAALVGVDRLLLISASEVGKRLAQHRNVIDAALQADVTLLAYTSIANADTTTMKLAAEHKATEQYLASSGLPYVLLRNGWYIENYTDSIADTLDRGVIVGSAGTGRVDAATRDDFAAAAAVVLTSADQAGLVYELGGDAGFTMTELAAELSQQTGQVVQYQDLSNADYVDVLASVGLPAELAEIFGDSSTAIARGELEVNSADLTRLLGRPAVTLADAISAALPAAVAD